MNNKKRAILGNDISNFIRALDNLNLAYITNNDINLFMRPSVVERYATRLYTHYEDWTTINNDLEVMDWIKKNLANITMTKNCKQFIEEQTDFEFGMLYYTAKLLNLARII